LITTLAARSGRPSSANTEARRGDQCDADDHGRRERRADRAGERRRDDQATAHAAADEVRGGASIQCRCCQGFGP